MVATIWNFLIGTEKFEDTKEAISKRNTKKDG